MPWVLLDVAVVLLTVGVLGLTGLRLYRAVRALLRRVGDAGERVGALAEGLQVSPPPARSGPTSAPAVHTPSARGSHRAPAGRR